MCECYQVGGPFIAEDPDCLIHGTASQGRHGRIEDIINMAISGELSSGTAVELIEEEFY